MKKRQAIKSHELAAMLLALPNLPVYRHRDDDPDPDEKGVLERIGTLERMTACDEDENPTVDCIVLDGVNEPAAVAEPANIAVSHRVETPVAKSSERTK